MDIQVLKEKILENNYIPLILEKLNCHHVVKKNEYYQCGNPDGDNKTAITVYLNENLTTIDYTRNIGNNEYTDIFDLVQFFQNCTFYEALRKVCNWCGIDYYKNNYDDLPESLKFTRLIEEMSVGYEVDYSELKPTQPISERILTYYLPFVNNLFKLDNISYTTQQIFEIGYDDSTNRITIPIRDELGTLVGVKGRLFVSSKQMNEEQRRTKYLYLEHCSRAKTLYGLYLTERYIKKTNCVYVVEAEKGVMQLWDMGIKNCVATCSKKISQQQIDMLTRLCSYVIFCFDKDVTIEEIKTIAEKFINPIRISAIIDNKNVLLDKESPTDDPEKFVFLQKNCCQIIKT